MSIDDRRPALAPSQRRLAARLASSGRCCSPCRSGCRDRRLHRARQPRRGHGAGGDVAQLPARLHRRAVASAMPPISASAPTARRWRSSTWRASTPLAHAGRRRCWAASPAMMIGALIVRLRGVYFAMVTIAFGQVFYLHRLSLEQRDRRRRRAARLAAPADRLRLRQLDIASNDKPFYYFAAGGVRDLRRR